MQMDENTSAIQLNPQEQIFIEKNGLHYEKNCALPRISGRIVGLLMVMPQPITIAEIGKTLQISHGSVSTNLRLVVMQGLVEKVTLPGNRCDHYQFSSKSWVEILKQKQESIHDLRSLAYAAFKDLEPTGVVKTRFEEMTSWTSLVEQKYNEMLEEMKK